jgi:beta-lactamase class A
MNLNDAIGAIIGRNQGRVGVAIKNLQSGKTILVDEGRVFPSASTIKLLIMSELMKEIEGGKRRLDEVVVLREEAKTGGDGILKELDAGHGFSLKEMITLMIIMSDNTATNILIDMVGMDAVNRRADELGMRETKLQRKMMDAAARKAGRDNFTCAGDMLRFLETTYEGSNVSKERSDLMLSIMKKQQATGRLDLYLPVDEEGLVIAHKTGDLDRLEHDVGIVYSPGCAYIICVLTNETRTNKDGREIIGEISKVVYDAFKRGN